MRPPVTVTQRPVEGGVDVTIRLDDGYRMEDGSTEVVHHVRRSSPPRVGQRVVCCGMLVKVGDVRYDESGRCWVIDEDTHAQLPWKG